MQFVNCVLRLYETERSFKQYWGKENSLKKKKEEKLIVS